MAKTRDKTISYRRAEWFTKDKKPRNLERLIKQAHGKLDTVAKRKFKRADGQWLKGACLQASKSGGYFLHIVAETPGDHASTLSQRDESKSVANVGTAPPPAGNEFMDGDIFVYIKGNNVCVCSTVLRDGAVVSFCRELFGKAKLGNDATQFDLHKIANVDKVKMIKAQGVKEIDIGASLYDATVSYMGRKDSTGALGLVGKHFSALFGKDKAPKPDNVSVGIVIKADGRGKGKELGARRMEALASDVLDEADDYSILTRSGQRITASEIFVREKVKIERLGKSVDRDKAWARLEKFYGDLKKAGITAQ